MPVDLGSAYGSIEIGTEGAEQSVQSLAASLRGTGMAMSAAFTLPLVGIATAAVTSAAGFEQSMNVMQQVSGATAAQMEGLQATALQLGAETSFSAGEAAGAMLELAKAGLSVDEVSASIGGTMSLAAAGGLDLALAAEITANAVNAFGLEASSANAVANMLAAAANASSVEVTDLAQGMNMASAVFASSGQSIETLNTALALLGNNGMKGSDAGTSLKTMMMRLSAPTDEAAATMQALGVSVYDVEGNMRSLPDIMADLQQAVSGTNAVTVTSSNLTADQAERMDYLKGTIEKTQRQLADYQAGIAGVAQSENDKVVAVDRLNRVLAAAQQEYAGLASVGGTTSTVMQTLTEEQRNQALTSIFGADAIRSVNILLKEGEAGWTDMAAALGNETAAADVANARMSGMAGAIEYMKGSIDSFLIGTALPFLDSMSGIVRQTADVISAFGTLPQPVKDAALAFGAVLAAAGPLMLAISGIGTVIGALLSPIGLVTLAIAGLAAAWVSDFGGIRTTMQPVVDAVIGWFQTQLPLAVQTAQGMFAALPTALAPVTTALAGLPATLGPVMGAVQSLGTGLAGVALQLQAFLAPAVARLQEAFGGLGGQFAAMGPQFAALQTALQTAWTVLQPILAGLAQGVGATLAVAMSLGINTLGAVFENLAALVGPILNQVVANITLMSSTVEDVAALIAAVIAGDWAAAWASAEDIVGNFDAFFRSTFENLTSFGSTLVETLASAVTDTLEDMGVDVGTVLGTLQSTWERVFNALSAPVDTVMEAVQGLWDGLTSFKDWLAGLTLPNPFAGFEIPSMPALPNPFAGNAEGASSTRGGWTMVGERGPEMVVMPPGASVLTNGQTNRAGARGEGRVININLGGVTVNNEMDVNQLGYRLASLLEGFGV